VYRIGYHEGGGARGEPRLKDGFADAHLGQHANHIKPALKKTGNYLCCTCDYALCSHLRF
jgi:hypothetical protein